MWLVGQFRYQLPITASGWLAVWNNGNRGESRIGSSHSVVARALNGIVHDEVQLEVDRLPSGPSDSRCGSRSGLGRLPRCGPESNH